LNLRNQSIVIVFSFSKVNSEKERKKVNLNYSTFLLVLNEKIIKYLISTCCFLNNKKDTKQLETKQK
jgi:hypothetical protein